MTIGEARKIVNRWANPRRRLPGMTTKELSEEVAKLVQREVNKAQKRIPIKGINPMSR